MNTSTDDQLTVNSVNQELWSAWIEKRRFRERIAARKRRVLIKIGFVILAFSGIIIYVLAVK